MAPPQHTGEQPEISKETALASLHAVLQSKTFSHSPSLRQTLEFIIRSSLSGSTEPIKEYSIATEVLGRTRDFDPKADNIVRVQMHRLREKLDEYYSAEGQADSTRIVIPRGQYCPEYARNVIEQPPAAPLADLPVSAFALKKRGLDWRWLLVIILVICNLALLADHFVASDGLPAALKPLWQPFLASSNPPLIVYANPAFLVSTRGNFYLYDRPTILSMPMGSRVATLGNDVQGAPEEEKGPFYYFDSYTGSGELVAAASIAEFLTAHGKPFLIKRSRIVSYEDIKDQNVIFLGGTGQDRILRNLPIPQDLVFRSAPADQIPMGSYIEDLKPPPGHPSSYRLQLDPSTGAIEIEYGLISLLPGVAAGHDALVLAGITTLGTQAAADFATSERYMEILDRMRTAMPPGRSRSPYIQAVLEVEVRDGVPLNVKCVLVRELNQPAH